MEDHGKRETGLKARKTIQEDAEGVSQMSRRKLDSVKGETKRRCRAMFKEKDSCFFDSKRFQKKASNE